MERSAVSKQAMAKSIDLETEKIKAIKYATERDQAKHELEKMLNEF